jgi:imidazolonepropionase-like amidohydrolase
MAARGVVLVPTLAIFDRVASMPGLDAKTRSLYESISRRAQEACRTAASEGVVIAAGTDSGGPETPHGSIATELRLLKAAGVAHEAVLAAATATAADLLRVGDEAGHLAVGRPAELVAVGGDVSTDINAIASVEWVMHRGRLLERPVPPPHC